ncbi:MAG: hypothetical protein HY912_09070, partial [Desulfomonile tiedjei]|nr:hypothetical protein [Desulfomonile tiedjei]
VAAIAVCFAIAPAESANLRAVPSLGFEERWDSNVFNTSGDEKGDFVFRVSPRLTLSIDAFNTTFSLGGGFDAERYSDHSELDRDSAAKDFILTTTQPVRITPEFSIRPSARLLETQDALRRNALTQTPVPVGPVSESLVTARTEVRETSGSLQMTYLLTPNVDLGIGGGVFKREFIEKPAGLIDSRATTLNASVLYRIDPRRLAGVYIDTVYNSYDGRPNSRIYTGGLLVTYNMTDRLTIDARAGASLDRESTGLGDEKNEVWSPTGRLSISYALRDFRAMLLGSHELSGAGSLGVTTKRSSILFTVADRFAPKWTWDLTGTWQINRSTDVALVEDFATAEGIAGIGYEAAEWAKFRLSGNMFRQWSHSSTTDDLKRNSVILGLTLSNTYPIF